MTKNTRKTVINLPNQNEKDNFYCDTAEPPPAHPYPTMANSSKKSKRSNNNHHEPRRPPSLIVAAAEALIVDLANYDPTNSPAPKQELHGEKEDTPTQDKENKTKMKTKNQQTKKNMQTENRSSGCSTLPLTSSQKTLNISPYIVYLCGLVVTVLTADNTNDDDYNNNNNFSSSRSVSSSRSSSIPFSLTDRHRDLFDVFQKLYQKELLGLRRKNDKDKSNKLFALTPGLFPSPKAQQIITNDVTNKKIELDTKANEMATKLWIAFEQEQERIEKEEKQGSSPNKKNKNKTKNRNKEQQQQHHPITTIIVPPESHRPKIESATDDEMSATSSAASSTSDDQRSLKTTESWNHYNIQTFAGAAAAAAAAKTATISKAVVHSNTKSDSEWIQVTTKNNNNKASSSAPSPHKEQQDNEKEENKKDMIPPNNAAATTSTTEANTNDTAVPIEATPMGNVLRILRLSEVFQSSPSEPLLPTPAAPTNTTTTANTNSNDITPSTTTTTKEKDEENGADLKNSVTEVTPTETNEDTTRRKGGQPSSSTTTMGGDDGGGVVAAATGTSNDTTTPLIIDSLQEQIQQLQLQLKETQNQLQHERDDHVKILQKEREDTQERMQGLQLRLYISETKTKNYEDALAAHIEAIGGEPTSILRPSVGSSAAVSTRTSIALSGQLRQPQNQSQEKFRRSVSKVSTVAAFRGSAMSRVSLRRNETTS